MNFKVLFEQKHTTSYFTFHTTKFESSELFFKLDFWSVLTIFLEWYYLWICSIFEVFNFSLGVYLIWNFSDLVFYESSFKDYNWEVRDNIQANSEQCFCCFSKHFIHVLFPAWWNFDYFIFCALICIVYIF